MRSSKRIKKILLYWTPTTLLLLALLFNTILVCATPETKVSIVPNEITVQQEEEFTISVMVTNVMDLSSWQLVLEYNATMLNCSVVWLPEDHVFAGKTIFSVEERGITSTGNDFLVYGAVSLEGSVDISNSAVLCKINFTTMESGFSHLRIATEEYPLEGSIGGAFEKWESVLLDSNLNRIPFETVDGLVSSGEAKIPPKASFSMTPLYPRPENARLEYLKTIPYPAFFVGEVIVFNASTSEDLDGNVIKYEWDFGDGNMTTVDVPIVYHVYNDTSLEVTVRLRVWDNDNLTSDFACKKIQIGVILRPLNWTPIIGYMSVAAIAVIVIAAVRGILKRRRETKYTRSNLT